MDEKKASPKVFLSYSSKDRLLVDKVALLMKSREIDIWYDEWKLTVGSSLINEIQEGIRKADFIIIFFSANSLSSPWVREEYEASKIRQIESSEKVRILPARLDNSELPQFMSSRVYADFRFSFVFGFTKLLGAILDEKNIGIIDTTFAKYAKILDAKQKQNDSLEEFSFSQFQKIIEGLRESRWHSAARSSGDLTLTSLGDDPYSSNVKKLTDHDARQFEEALGNTTRDFLQFKLFDITNNYLHKVEEKEPVTFCSHILEHLYSNLIQQIQSFGLPTFRNADAEIAKDVDRLFAFLVESDYWTKYRWDVDTPQNISNTNNTTPHIFVAGKSRGINYEKPKSKYPHLRNDEMGNFLCPECNLPFKSENDTYIHIENWHAK